MRGQALHQRWELTIRGADTVEAGDLRFSGATGRVLLQHDDSAFQPLQQLRVDSGRISFVLARGRRVFNGVIADSMYGTARNADGSVVRWVAVRIPTSSAYLPVLPRVVVRQLAMGRGDTVERIPGAWLAAAPALAEFEPSYRALAGSTGIAPLSGRDRAARASSLSLGLIDDGRAGARAVLESIARGPEGGAEFRSIFTRDGAWKIDIHDAMPGEAAHNQVGFRMSRVADGLRLLGEIPANADSNMIRAAAWRLWCITGVDTLALRVRLDTLGQRDPVAAGAIRAMLGGYDDATRWWRRAVSWLLTRPWLDTPAGPRSPAQLMARFWGADSLQLPTIRDHRFGAFAAMPIVSIDHIASRLFTPANAIAAEWLPDSGRVEVFSSWRQLRWGESPPLTVATGTSSVTLASPWSQAMVHPATFFGSQDEIQIEPGIMPLAAVAAFLHEWNHLVLTHRRLTGTHPFAIVDAGYELRLREDDPWLSEGFAEWATDEILRSARPGVGASFLRFTQEEKRLSIAEDDPNDPHVLGYRLILAATKRVASVAALRDRLVAGIHDLDAIGRALGLSGGTAPALRLQRPSTAVVIPEVSFTWADGALFNLARRLVIPNTRSEH